MTNVILYNGKSGMQAFQNKLDIISNNIANMDTTGYKKINLSFQDLLKNEMGEYGTPMSDQLEGQNPAIGSGVKTGDPYRTFTQGALVSSTNPIEIAIEGNGFMGFRDGNNNFLLSRAGNLSISSNGNLVDENGNKLSVNGSIDLSQYSADQIKIDQTGNIMVTDDLETISAGKIMLYDAVNKDSLTDAGQNYFRADERQLINSDSQNGASYLGKINQGYTEKANTYIGDEIVDMITAQRAYQLSSKSIEAADDMWKVANNLTK